MTGVPRATYRIQFGPGMTFRDAEALVPYLARLGISHLYASPILKARKGSTHGYDITDHNALNEELGEEEDFDALVAELHRNGMGLVLDFVPNHMGVGRADNAWWLDVLEWGPVSPYAHYFDIDWQPAKPELRGKVLLPFLGDHYGSVLERGELELRFEADAGTFSVWYHDHRFPVAPRDYGRILSVRAEGGNRPPGGETASLIQAFRDPRLGRPVGRRIAEARRLADKLKCDLARRARSEPAFRERIRGCLDDVNGTAGDSRSFLTLHRLLQRQHYRPAYWRVAANEINYRRFFDINELAGIRIEWPDVFDAVHRTVLRWIDEGKIQGLRIDHIDGLFDPEGYCSRLRAAVERLPGPSAERGSRPFYLTVEKILAQHEALRSEWPVSGTTGYEFTNLVNGLFVDPDAESTLDRAYRRFTGNSVSFDEVVYSAKLYVLDHLLSAELNVLANDLDRISESNWRTRDFTLDGVKNALRQIAACFPVYRTYVTSRRTTEEDRRDIGWAIAWARKRLPDGDSGLFDFLHSVLTVDLVRRRRSGYGRQAVVGFAMKFQQFTGPVMAKALEDTSFYRFNRMVSLNEVGGDPRRFSVSTSAFHHLNAERLRRHRHAMLATTTHDTKRSEDARVRISVLSEMAGEWTSRVRRWGRMNRAARRDLDGAPAPSRNDEYLLYQALIGVWPSGCEGDIPDDDTLEMFRERIERFMVKSVREAKTRSGWSRPDIEYEEATVGFVRHVLDPQRSALFLSDFLSFQRRAARVGMVSALSQAVLKFCAPGVPDIYQGTEYWDLSLVDPDNRRAVDFAGRNRTLTDLVGRFEELWPCVAGFANSLLGAWPDGRIKQFITWRLLDLRRRFPDVFLDGAYEPLLLEGPRSENVCAFARRHGNVVLIAAAPRLLATVTDSAEAPSTMESLWRGTWAISEVVAPDDGLVDVFTGRRVDPDRDVQRARLSLEELFATLPVAVLLSRPAGAEI